MSIAYDSKIVVSRYEHIHGRLVCYSECQRLKSDIYLSLSVWHSTSITNPPRENLSSEAFGLTIYSFTV